MKRWTCVMVVALNIATAAPVLAQLNGENLLGDNGVKSGSQPSPGTYVGFLYYRYGTDTIKNKDGETLTFDPGQPASMTMHAALPLLIYVSKAKVLGANYGFMAGVPIANAGIEAPAFGLQTDVSTGLSDSYFVPLQLGWHLSRADVITAFGFFAPTGRYTAGASDNLGKGMWSYELSAGTTLYFDEAKTLSFATTAYWETHTKKSGASTVAAGNVTLSNAKVGQLLTLEGGFGKSFLEGAASVGLAYYGQFKLTRDDFGLPLDIDGGRLLGKHRVWGFGPDVTVPIATRSKLIALVNVRYLWETGARVKTEGQTFVATATFPVPSIGIPPKK